MQQRYQTERLAVDNLIRGQPKKLHQQFKKQSSSLVCIPCWPDFFLIYWNGSAAILILCNQNCFPAFLSYKCVTTVFILNQGRVTVFLARKKLLHVTSILYIQAKLPVKINLNYLQVSKNLYIKNYLLPTNIIVSVDPCPLSPIFWCFRAGFCDLLLSKPRELPTGAFFQSRNSGESVPCRDKWSKRTGRILAEYYLRIQYIRPLGWGTTLGLHLSTSLDLRFHLFPQPMCHQQSQRSSGHPF